MSWEEVLASGTNNWGRWGDEDELGTLNLITDEVRRDALALARTGSVLGCAHDIAVQSVPSVTEPRNWLDTAVARFDVSEQEVTEYVGLVCHGSRVTHLDSPAHFFDGRNSYNGHPRATVEDGLSHGGIHLATHGIATRGILIDLTDDGPGPQPGEAFTSECLDRALSRHRTTVTPGSAVLVRTGCATAEPEECSPGPDPKIALWLHANDVAVWGSDTHNDVTPVRSAEVGFAFHRVALVQMGLWLIDNMALDALAAECRRRGSNEFLFVVAPLLLRHCSGSAVTPLALM